MIQRNAVIERLKYLLKVPVAINRINNSTVASRARETLADTIEPYRWSDKQLATFVDDGISELKGIRSDVERLGYAPDAFTSPVANYTVYRALAVDNDAQNNNGTLSDKYLAIFREQAAGMPYYFSDEQLAEFADKSVTLIISRRPELRISANGTIKDITADDNYYDLPERFFQAVVDGAASFAAAHSKNEQSQYFFEQFNGALQTI